ncbi:MAG: DUF2892 domain-containing protein [Candidatus Nanohaloarchaeota archaeon QJJ-9]|nr:DUF2892 domain-containing protein [Candidatus Nanohaloarchaeota archaeon QJJ-9]
MMEKNVGNMDRIVRLVLGVLLVALAAVSYFGVTEMVSFGMEINAVAAVVGVVLVVTGFLKTCPLYSVVGFDTRE